MLKASRYNLYFTVPQGKVIFNGLTGAFVQCAPAVWDLVRAESLSGLSPATAAGLAELGFLTDGTTEQELRQFLAQVGDYLQPQGLNIYFMPSYNCNFRCPYCFEKWRLSKGEAWLTQVMTPQQVQGYYQALAAHPLGQKITGVGLYGGEPFLPEHRAAISSILAGAAQLGVKDTYAISNGYNLDLYVELLKKYQLREVTITLDGTPASHDKRRFLADGQGTYAKIAANIGLLLSHGIGVKLRTNMDSSNVADLPALQAEAARRGWTAYKNFSLLVARAKNTAFSNDIPSQRTGDRESRLRQALGRQTFLPPVFNFCLATGNTWIIDPFGDIYPCLEFVGKPALAIGKISAQGIELNAGYTKMKNRRALKLDGCKNCAYQLFCAGGCAALAQDRLGDFSQGYCDLVKQQADKAILRVLTERVTALPRGAEIAPLNKGYRELYARFSPDQLRLLAGQHATLRMRLYLEALCH